MKDMMFICSSDFVDLSLLVPIGVVLWLHKNAISVRMSLVAYCAVNSQQDS
jgi:hypothetical protein